MFKQLFGRTAAVGFFANPENIPPHIAQVFGIEAEDFRAIFKARQGCGKIVGRSGTHVTKVLRNDEVGRELLEGFRIDTVEALTAGDVLADQAIHFGWRSIARDARMNHDALGPGLGRKIALVADADDFGVKTQGEKNLRRRGKQRDDTHERNLA